MRYRPKLNVSVYVFYIYNEPLLFYFTFYFREQTRVSDIKLCRIHKRKFAVRTHAHSPRTENGPQSVFPKGMSGKIFSGRWQRSFQFSFPCALRDASVQTAFGAMCERVLCSTHVASLFRLSYVMYVFCILESLSMSYVCR